MRPHILIVESTFSLSLLHLGLLGTYSMSVCSLGNIGDIARFSLLMTHALFWRHILDYLDHRAGSDFFTMVELDPSIR